MSKNLSDIFPPTEIGGGGGGGIEEAPKTGKMYARKDEAWSEFEAGDIEPGSKDGETLAWSTADAEWMPNDTLIVKDDKAGIGTNSPGTTLDVNGTFRYGSSGIDAPDADAAIRPGFYMTPDVSTATNYPPHFINGCASLVTIAGNNQNNSTQLAFAQNDFKPAFRNKRAGNLKDWCEFVVTDANGNVGIGMAPLRSTAKEQLAEWKSQFDARLKAEPKADKKAVTLEITDDAFEVLPTEDKLAEWMETRAAGDKLQVNGNISASGSVSAGTSTFSTENVGGAAGPTITGANGISVTMSNNGGRFFPSTDGLMDLGSPGYKWKDAHFAGTVNLGKIAATDESSVKIDKNGGQALLVSNSNATASHGLKIQHGGNGSGTFPILVENNVGVETFKVDGAGDVTAKGDIKASYSIEAGSHLKTGLAVLGALGTGLRFGSAAIYPCDSAGNVNASANWSLGDNSWRFEDGYFSGNVDANTLSTNRPTNGTFFTMSQGANSSRFAHEGGNALVVYPLGGILNVSGGLQVNGVPVGGSPDLSDYYTKTESDNNYQPKGSYYTQTQSDNRYLIKFGDSTVSGTITATDFIATSDERAKDNITTAPAGLIDSLKGREWDWKESGERGSGVVAQELEQVLPHLVHTDDEGMKSVAYNGLVAYLIEELKDCRERLAALEAKS